MSTSSGDTRRRVLRQAQRIVFLCSGNMVRSAFAEIYARHLGCPTAVCSAATIYRNNAIFPETDRALRARGVSVQIIRRFRPTHMDDLMPHLEGMPIFLGMQHHHLEALRPWPAHHERGFLLNSQHELADPVLEDADFDSTFARVAASVEELIKGLGSGLPSNRGWPLP